MLIKPKKRYHVTKGAHHQFRKYKNQIIALEISRLEEV